MSVVVATGSERLTEELPEPKLKHKAEPRQWDVWIQSDFQDDFVLLFYMFK